MSKLAQRALDHIATHTPISVGLVACDLRLEVETVKRVVDKLMSDGKLTYGWDGQCLELTDEARRERQENEAFRASLKSLKSRT